VGKGFQEEEWPSSIEGNIGIYSNILKLCKLLHLSVQYDIREASQEIRDSYKMYYKLKTSFLEETLNDVLSEDGFDVLEMSQASDLGVSMLDQDLSLNGGPQLPLDISALVEPQSVANLQELTPPAAGSFSNLQDLPNRQVLTNLVNRDENHVIRKFEAVEELPINQNAWGKDVSKKLAEPPQPLEASMSAPVQGKQPKVAAGLKPSLSAKLFQSTRGFAKRNPRKPLSNSSINASSSTSTLRSVSTGPVEELPDFETILIRKAQEYKEKELALASNSLLAGEHSKETIKTQVDDGWLQRNTTENTLEADTPFAETNNNSGPSRKTNFGLANLDLSKLKPSIKEEKQVQVKNEQDEATKVLQASNSSVINEKPAQTPSASSQKITSKHKPRRVGHETDSDSDSVVAESEEEPEPQEYRQLAKRRKIMPTAPDSIQVAAKMDSMSWRCRRPAIWV